MRIVVVAFAFGRRLSGTPDLQFGARKPSAVDRSQANSCRGTAARTPPWRTLEDVRRARSWWFRGRGRGRGRDVLTLSCFRGRSVTHRTGACSRGYFPPRLGRYRRRPHHSTRSEWTQRTSPTFPRPVPPRLSLFPCSSAPPLQRLGSSSPVSNRRCHPEPQILLLPPLPPVYYNDPQRATNRFQRLQTFSIAGRSQVTSLSRG